MTQTFKQALVVVDVQRDFVEGGSLAVAGGQAVADALNNLVIPTLHKANVPVLYTKDWHIDPGEHFSDNPDYQDSWPVHCAAGTEGADFAADFDFTEDEVFKKGQYAASYSGAEGVNMDEEFLADVLKDIGVTLVDVVGIAYDYCVKATAIDLARAGFKVNVIKDFTASVHPENDEQTTAELYASGVVVYDGREYRDRMTKNQDKN